MMTFRWSWIFILHSLLVQLGRAASADNVVDPVRYLSTAELDPAPAEYSQVVSSSQNNIGVIVVGVIAGVVVTLGFFLWYSRHRKRKVETHVEEGMAADQKERSHGSGPELKSAFSPDEKKDSKFDRIREAFIRRAAKRAPMEPILPVYRAPSPSDSVPSISPPAPTVPTHMPRYPSVLERGYGAKPRPTLEPIGPPPQRDLPRKPSTDTIGSNRDVPNKRKLQKPPTAVLAPTSGRALAAFDKRLPGLVRGPKSPLRRKSWLSKKALKHPFIPVREPEPSLLSASIRSNQYHPSRQHLVARLELRSPGVRREPSQRQPVSAYEDDAGRRGRLMEALEGSGSRTALPHSAKRTGLDSSAYI